jgi:hypothetical protein
MLTFNQINYRLIFERKSLQTVAWSPTMVSKVHFTMKLYLSGIHVIELINWKLTPAFVF